jgi:hypothetical protein
MCVQNRLLFCVGMWKLLHRGKGTNPIETMALGVSRHKREGPVRGQRKLRDKDSNNNNNNNDKMGDACSKRKRKEMNTEFWTGSNSNDDKMGDACSKSKRKEINTGFWPGNLQERDHLQDKEIDVTLKHICSENGSAVVWTDYARCGELSAHGVFCRTSSQTERLSLFPPPKEMCLYVEDFEFSPLSI